MKKIARRPMNPGKLIALVFVAIILLGTCLLLLPFSSRDGQCCGFMTALFTATSSTCVTGLILADTWTQWSFFGQVVLLCLIETGGLGFMSLAAFVILLARKKIDFRTQMLISQAIGVDDARDIVRIQKRILSCSLIIEGTGAVILFFRFLSEFGAARAAWIGTFLSVSAYCNAGFDVIGFIPGAGSVTPYATDPTVLLTLSCLIILGGLGFVVFDDVLRIRRPKKRSLYTRLVLTVTAILLVSGTILFCLTEWRNPDTLGEMNFFQKILAAFFQSSSTRTAGFDGLGQGNLTDAGKAVTVFYMLIGGSSGSTAGGLKTVTFAVIILFLIARLRGRDTVTVGHRTIPEGQVLNALTVFGFMIVLAFSGAAVISATSPISFTDALYETVSAVATVGLTTGVTTSLSLVGKIIIILYMYFGRVGILTLSLGFLQTKRGSDYRYAETNLLIG